MNPEGLIACRPPAGSSHAQMIGSFEFQARTPVGPTPYLIIVLAVDAQGAAQIVAALLYCRLERRQFRQRSRR